MICDANIAFCAFRYALGRMTAMPSHVADFLIENKENFMDHERHLIVMEIREAIACKKAGMDCDVRTWLRVVRSFVGSEPC